MKRIDWNALDEREREAVLRRPVQAVSDAVRDRVEAIFEDVAARGDDALRDYTAKFDGVTLADFEVGTDEFAAARAAVPADVQSAIAEAASRIEAFHRAGVAAPYELETAPGLLCQRVQRPIARVGLYVPAGSAPLPSTALMLAIPAQLAGCREIILCTPPRKDGSADPAVLLAAQQAPGVRVFKLGGAQAIAAMALGTGSMPRCDKLFGPGNSWVDEAKRQALQRPGGIAIDMPAGPSEVLVIADAGADPAFVASDLLSQAEHGPDSQVLLVSDNDALLDAVAVEVELQLARLPRAAIATQALAASRLVRVGDIAQAIEVSDAYAPEHLILAVREPRDWLDRVQNAGSIFLGDWTPEALGDYCSGSNHVLPTGGAARAWSGLSVASFQKAITVQDASRAGIAAAGPCAATLAHAEGLQAHARAVELRLERAA
ncbi:MAG TPA: histidinol dehydrogenase [Thermomonas sp.]|jgi:histidinol dehydrogenase|uniref:histidinol dehydrogenase n=1 Tax=Thermomonas sp. TaxID=1971895 RepID=UPI002C6172F3|nr:histidinol dehydrogenase [Thermomonas sp.]HOZ23322.1 histidinol dehydrogenase [Thermomonas sp.]HPM57174.1 histidinol dehydrogenase [Thermomonas sp.]HPW12758.1 histidinol dehydrogenase [Thermomonas sp.]